MSTLPVVYRQYDPRWSNVDYSAPGEKTNIMESGCGPTCAASLVSTIRGLPVTPKDACEWSLQHGYKAVGHGTYYSFFEPYFAEFGVECERLNQVEINTLAKVGGVYVAKAKFAVQKGDYVIACLRPSIWTKSGHFVVVYTWGNYVSIMDPASAAANRAYALESTFLPAIKYLWIIRSATVDQTLLSEIDNHIKIALAAQTKVYTKLDEIAVWYRPQVEKAIELGVLQGDENGRLNLTDSDLKALTFVMRLHELKEG